jgi:hypothetical protein
MAINFLGNITLLKNQLLQARIENQDSDANAGASPGEGQIYFNTSNNVLRIYANAQWTSVGSGVQSVVTTNGNFIDLTPTTAANGAVTVTADLSAADAVPVAGTRFLAKDNKWRVPSPSANTEYSLAGAGAANGTAAVNLSGSDTTSDSVIITGTGSTTVVRAGNTLTVNSTDTNEGTVKSVATGAGLTGGTITEAGTISVNYGISNANIVFSAVEASGVADPNETPFILVGQSTAGTPNGPVTRVRLQNIDLDQFGAPTSSLSMGTQKIVDLVDPTLAQDAATKQYVDDSVVGGLIYQGGYRADTNVPNLDSGTSIAVDKGWTYTVTEPGLFFTEQVRVGDVLISEIDQAAGASALANWTTVQNNVDLASSTQVGIGNVLAGNAVDVTYAAGSATVSVEDSSAINKGAVVVAAGTGIDVTYTASGIATVTNSITNATNSATGSIAIGATSGTVTHAFGINTMVQTLNANGDTVYCDITRTATTSVATINTAQAGVITILVQKIG